MGSVNVTPPQLSTKQIERFWLSVDKSPGFGPNGDCWKWTTNKTKRGCGNFSANYRVVYAHRVCYFLTSGVWPELHVLHRCDNPPCVNPEHLWLGTHQENIKDRDQKGRGSGGWRKGGGPWGIWKGSTHPVCGELHSRAKLRTKDIPFIRESVASKMSTMAALARRFGVSGHTIRDVVRGVSWKHV